MVDDDPEAGMRIAVRESWVSRTVAIAPVLAPMLLSAFLSIRQVTNLPLSHDEFYTLDAVGSGLGTHLWEAPLVPYYAIVWASTLGGSLTSDALLRSTSAVSIVITVGLTAQLARMFGRPWLGYPAGLLMAFNSVALSRAAEARPYAFGTMLATASSLTLFIALRRKKKRWMFLYSALVLLLMVTFPQGVLVLLPQAALVVGDPSFRKSWRSWLMFLSPVLLAGLTGAVLAWLNVFPNMHNWLGTPRLLQIPEAISWVGGAGTIGSWAEAAVAGAVIVLGLSGAVRALTVGALAAAVVLFLASQGGTSFWLPGSMAGLVPLVVAAAAVNFDRLQKSSCLLIILTVFLLSIPVYTASRIERKGEADMRVTAQIISSNGRQAQQVFGDATDAYGLWPTIRHYGLTTEGFTPTLKPVGRFWLLYGDLPCGALRTWDVGGGMQLRLCSGV